MTFRWAPISSILTGSSLINHPFGGTPTYGTPQINARKTPEFNCLPSHCSGEASPGHDLHAARGESWQQGVVWAHMASFQQYPPVSSNMAGMVIYIDKSAEQWQKKNSKDGFGSVPTCEGFITLEAFRSW